MDILKSFEEKIAFAVEKIKILKNEKTILEKQVEQLENMMKAKDQEMDKLVAEKTAIKTRIEDLFNELESIELK
ncbi:MAG: cell division protein ZapB [Nitrospirae bacterium]|nr:cell division protein ZapB [Nitrospirota bacterium]